MTMGNLKRSVGVVGGTLANVVHCKRVFTDLDQQDIFNKVWNEYMGAYKRTSTSFQDRGWRLTLAVWWRSTPSAWWTNSGLSLSGDTT